MSSLRIMKRMLSPCSAVLLSLALQLPAAEDPATATVPLRAALHEDATLEAPLTQLVDAWRKADRLPELLALYRSHLSQYPQDSGAAVVLVRLLQSTRDPAAAATVRKAVADFPNIAYLRWLAFLILDEINDPAALDALAKAVELETVTWRRDQWTERLIATAVKRGRREMVERYLTEAASAETTAIGKLSVGRRLAVAGLHTQALGVFTAGLAADPAPEVFVDLHIDAAASETALKLTSEAGKRLDELLNRLGPDHWRRAEITRRRLELAGSESERNAMIEAARARVAASPGDDAAALDLARLLIAADRRRDALAVLTTATTGQNGGARLEQELLTLHERVHDPAALDAWLAQRIAAQPTRTDLGLRRVRTLIDLGKGEEATALRQRLTKDLRPAERDERLLTLARELRRDGRHAEGAQVLEELLVADPQRLDLTRELSEAWLAAGNRGRAEELLGRDLPATAAPEQVLDLVQFLIGARQYLAASRAITARLALDPGFFELRVQAIRLAGRTGDVRGALQAAMEARALTDTSARYRLWLESAVEAAGQERDAAYLEEEMTRLSDVSGPWDGPRLERLLAFAEICVARDRAEPAITLLDTALSDPQFPRDRRSEARRQLVALLERVKDQSDNLAAQLELLAKEDPALATECRVRAALLAFDPVAQNRDASSIARDLAGVDVEQLSDPTLVARLETAFREAGSTTETLACLKRLTALEPATAGHWERWLTALGTNGNEPQLREAIRRLLAGVDNLELKNEIRTQLAQRLADSCWRSAAAQAALATPEGWQAVLALLDEASTSNAREDAGWILTGRALALHHLGRFPARDQTLAELDANPKLALVFPDGLGTSRDALRALLADPVVTPTPPPDRALPPGPWGIAWSAAFSRSMLGAWAEGNRVVVALVDGGLIGLDRTTGARVWEITTANNRKSQGPVDPYSGVSQTPRGAMLRPTVLGGKIIVASGRDVSAYNTNDGTLLWRCNVLEADGVLADDHHLMAWSDDQGRAAGIDPTDGRLRWTTDLPTLSKAQFQSASQTLSGGNAVLLGKHAAVVDLRSGIIRWSFSDAEVVDATVSLAPTPTPPLVIAPMQSHRISHRHRQWASGHFYHQSRGVYQLGVVHSVTGEPSSASTWTTSFINRARQPWASVVACGNDLLIGDWSTSAVIPLTLPLRCTPMPSGTVLGTYGRRLLTLTATHAQVSSLDTGELIAQIPLEPISLRQEEVGLTEQNTGIFMSGTVHGRLAWLSGPGGVMTIDLDSCLMVDQQRWNLDWSVSADGITSWALSSAIVQQGNSISELLPIGFVTEGLVALPVGSQRLVALAVPRADAGNQPGGRDGR